MNKRLPSNIEFRKLRQVPIIRTNGEVDVISTAKVGDEVELRNGIVRVLAPCKIDNGIWRCITHVETFRTQIAKDFHISEGSHKLAWNCYEHGIEQP